MALQPSMVESNLDAWRGIRPAGTLESPGEEMMHDSRWAKRLMRAVRQSERGQGVSLADYLASLELYPKEVIAAAPQRPCPPVDRRKGTR